MTDDVIAAIHDGAHGVVASCFGFHVHEIVLHRIGERDDAQGYCRLRNHVEEIDADGIRYLQYILSGAAAERRLTGRYSARDGQDLEHALTAASVVLEVERDSPRAAQLVRDAQTLADAMMLQDDVLWAWVQRTAKALIRKRRLTGRDIQLLKEAS